MTQNKLITELENIESSLNNNDIDEAKIDLYLLLKELLQTVTVEDNDKLYPTIEISGC